MLGSEPAIDQIWLKPEIFFIIIVSICIGIAPNYKFANLLLTFITALAPNYVNKILKV